MSERPEDYCFANDFKALNGNLKKSLPYLFKQGIEITSRDLRATYQQWLEESGVADVRVKHYVGHSTLTVHERYRSARTKETHYLNTERELIAESRQANRNALQPVEKKPINYFEWSK